MAIPDFQTLMLPLLELAADGQERTLADAIEALGARYGLTKEEREELLPSRRQPRFDNRVSWSATYLKKAGLLQSPGRSRYQITERGRELLASRPNVVNLAFLSQAYPEIVQFRKARPVDEEEPAVFDAATGWRLRPEVQRRVRATLEGLFPDEGLRRDVLELMALALENADEERSDGWYLKESRSGLRLMAGRVLAAEIRPSGFRLGVLGPVSDELCTALGADAGDADTFKLVPGGLLLRFPAERAKVAAERLMGAVNDFVDVAMATVKRSVTLEYHCPEAVAYLSEVLGRELPQPSPRAEEEREEDEEEVASREPRVRGRAPIFEPGQRSIASLVADIEHGVMALPDMQRSFVWEDTQVRDLLDSLLLGFPVGTLVLWHTGTEKDARAIGSEQRRAATTLVIDGQQRLTSLNAVVRGEPVVGKDGEERRIRIAFRPRDGSFEVHDAAIEKDPEFLSDVTELWRGPRTKSQIRKDLLNRLRDAGRPVDDAYEEAAENNLERAHRIAEYHLPTVEIRKTAMSAAGDATDEDVAEIFVRINNQGSRLGQVDFVLTLLSVFHPKLRDRIEDSARAMSEGSLVELDAQQLLRAACAVAFSRARMSAVYRSLRGVDPVTGEAEPEKREERLRRLDEATDACMELTPWRDYLLRVQHAGFVNAGLITSKNAVINAYAFYVRGRQVRVPKAELDELIARWLFGSLMTARYSGASETAFERDLNRLEEQGEDPAAFVRAMESALEEGITADYWGQPLMSLLATQRGRAPAALAFRAAQVVLGARALFSDQLLQNLLNPPAKAGKAAAEQHHLFPVAWLKQRGVRDRRRINQVANLADTGWYENTVIGAKGPAEYVPRIRDVLKLDDDRWGRMCAEHALPPGWESMGYDEFLVERRRRMAELIRAAYRKLGGERDAGPIEPPWFVGSSEAVWRSIVETERALRAFVRDVYSSRFGAAAPRKIEAALSERERETLGRALRSRPAGADPMSVVDYLYLGQLPGLLFASEVWGVVSERIGKDGKQRIQRAVEVIAPVRNEIAHVREVEPKLLMRAKLASGDLVDALLAAKN